MVSSHHFNSDIIITAMDRFVWFILLVVMSHLVAEFTRVTGYTRGNTRSNPDEQNALNYRPLPTVNDSLNAQGRQVQSLVFFPATVHDYAYYAPPPPPPAQIIPLPPMPQMPPQQAYQQPPQLPAYQQQPGNAAPLLLPNGGADQPQSGATVTAAAATSGFSFSLRPLIDSIFDIPISTLRAVNNLVARLTGSYQHQQSPGTTTHQFPGGRSMTGGSGTGGFVSPKADAVNFLAADNEEDDMLLAQAVATAKASGGGGVPAKKTMMREVGA